ncbi:uncharacterized protein SOCE26_079230 [Sorangium cellulosum]|uniref:Uncharacterized protein n=1 Tax=Sorangium cellulosum TaxID=56 RepID=A0A2L0F4F8_SORCE|nr:hypothetical protein [Sorangium cellulosum]AUX46417.1 uncharacterized protein SOCE26_079230 [Sorangium cellulosum]
MPTPYRDDLDALNARHDLLAEELAAVKQKTAELSALQQDERRIEEELEVVRRRLDGMAARRALPLLDNVRVASPCTADWEEMAGDDRVRFCGHCQKHVYNLSEMPRDEAEQFIRKAAGEACIRLYRRADGTVITADCPVGARVRRARGLALAAVGSGALVAGAAFAGVGSCPVSTSVVMGSMVSEGPLVPSDPPRQDVTRRQVVFRDDVRQTAPGAATPEKGSAARTGAVPLRAYPGTPGVAVKYPEPHKRAQARPSPAAETASQRGEPAPGAAKECGCAPGDSLCTCL